MISPSEKKTGNPPVANGRLVYTSVSAMQKADTCLRAWRYRYVEGLPDKPLSKGAQRGIEGHARLERYLRGEGDTLDRVERLGVERGFVPSPGPDLLVESKVSGRLDALGVPLTGKIDLVNARAAPLIELTDWKFKKNLEDWAATAEELIDPTKEAGVQMLGYAASRAKDAKVALLRIRHVTFQTQGRADVEEVASELTPKEALERWGQVSERIIPRMASAAAANSPENVDRNLSACDRYGGCPFKSTCLDPITMLRRFNSNIRRNADPIIRDTQTEATNNMGMLSVTNSAPRIIDVPAGHVLAQDAKQGAEYIVNGKQTTFACATNMGGRIFYSFLTQDGVPELVKQDTVVQQVAPPTPAAPPPLPAAQALPQVLPPDAPKSDPAKAARTDAVPEVPPAPAPVAAVPAAPPPAPIPQESAPKRGRGRPPKAQRSVAPVDGAPPVQRDEGICIYVGCTPLGVEVQTLHAYADSLDQQLRESMQQTAVPDLRSLTATDFGFGKWKGYLAKLVLENPPPAGHYYVGRGDERVEVIAETLQSIASLIVVGRG